MHWQPTDSRVSVLPSLPQLVISLFIASYITIYSQLHHCSLPVPFPSCTDSKRTAVYQFWGLGGNQLLHRWQDGMWAVASWDVLNKAVNVFLNTIWVTSCCNWSFFSSFFLKAYTELTSLCTLTKSWPYSAPSQIIIVSLWQVPFT